MDIKVLEITDWNTPASEYKPEQVANHRLGNHTYRPGIYPYHGMDGYTAFTLTKPTRVTTLLELATNSVGTLRWKEWMVDSPTDYRAMQKYALGANGRVLTTGLGLGLVTHELCKNDKVDSITIVELSPSVIKLVGKYLPDDPRITIVNENFWTYIDKDNSQWDNMIIDIWVYWGLEQQYSMYKSEILPASKKLKDKYPDTNIVFHGFAGLPTEEQLDKVVADGNITNPLVIDPLIYGLGV